MVRNSLKVAFSDSNSSIISAVKTMFSELFKLLDDRHLNQRQYQNFETTLSGVGKQFQFQLMNKKLHKLRERSIQLRYQLILVASE